MVLQSKEDQLASAWRALSSKAEGQGWKVIDIFKSTNCSVMAGRRGEGNEEGLLVGIAGVSAPKNVQLPNGQGFAFIRTELQGDTSGHTWFALVRQQEGSLPLFSLMAGDLVSLLDKSGSEQGARIYSLLVARIRAWQDFMKRDRSGVLSAEEEIGLIGELIVLGNLMVDGMLAPDAVESWMGPEDGLHDFVIGNGGIEAKTTVASVGFIAKIGSLDQLDNSLYQPLYIGAVRLMQSLEGKTLPEFINELMVVVRASGATALLSSRLVSAGYADALREQYSRRFLLRELSYRLVKNDSPRLTRSHVSPSIQEAKYSLDIDTIPVVASTFKEISENLGILK